MSVLAVDVGTSGVRAAVVRPDSSVERVHQLQVLPSSPSQGFVEFDAAEIARAVLEVSTAALAGGGSVDAVGISSQRASTVVWDRVTGDPVGPGIGWQDLRTVGYCLALQAQGIRLAPNQSATKLAVLLDIADPDRSRDLCAGTVDTWVAWTLSRGSLHVSDRSNLAVTGLLDGNELGIQLLAIIGQVATLQRQRSAALADPAHALASSVLELLRTEYAKDLSGAVIADRLGYSYAYLERVFRGSYQRSIHQELLRARVQAAAHSLRMGKPIKRVAHEVGFGDYYYFLKVFKRVKGVSPGVFQASHRPR